MSSGRRGWRVFPPGSSPAISGLADGAISAADALGAWASKVGLWPEAAQAYRTAASARRELFGTQTERTHRDVWLARGRRRDRYELAATGLVAADRLTRRPLSR
jgi:hypothetical protein